MKLNYKHDVVCTPLFTLVCLAQALEAVALIVIGVMLIEDWWSFDYVTAVFLAKLTWTAIDLCRLSPERIKWYRFF